MPGHRHNPNAGTQNQGNALGDRPAVRMSKLYRMHEGGNNMKSILGSSHLSWDMDQQQGAYQGMPVYDHLNNAVTTHRSAAYLRHQQSVQDSYSRGGYETTSKGYGVGYDENTRNTNAHNQHMHNPHFPAKGVDAGRRRSYGNDSSAIAGAFQQQSDVEDVQEYPRSHSNFKASQQQTAYMAMRAQRDSDDAYGGYGSHSNNSSSLVRKDTRPW